MRLTQGLNLRAEDFPEFKEAESLFRALNPFFTDVGNIFDHNIDYTANIKSVTKDYVSTGVQLPIVFEWPFPKFAPAQLSVISARVNNTPSILLAAWEYNASTFEVSISKLFEVTAAGNAAPSNANRYAYIVRVTI